MAGKKTPKAAADPKAKTSATQAKSPAKPAKAPTKPKAEKPAAKSGTSGSATAVKKSPPKPKKSKESKAAEKPASAAKKATPKKSTAPKSKAPAKPKAKAKAKKETADAPTKATPKVKAPPKSKAKAAKPKQPKVATKGAATSAPSPSPVPAPPPTDDILTSQAPRKEPSRGLDRPTIRSTPPGKSPVAARKSETNGSRLKGARKAEESEVRWDLPPSNFGGAKPGLRSLSLPQTGPWNVHEGLREARATRVDKAPPPQATQPERRQADADQPKPSVAPADLPTSYGETGITAVIRDPEWLFVYWEVSDGDRERVGLPRGAHNRPLVLRLVHLKPTDLSEDPAKPPTIVPVNDSVSSWYVKVPAAGRIFTVELATYSERGDLVVIARSEPVEAPLMGLSEELPADGAKGAEDEGWREVYNQILRLSGGPEVQKGPNSEDFVQVLQQRLFPAPGSPSMFSGVLSSGALFGGEQPVIHRLGEKGRDFWLEVGVDVIVYGATEPDASVSLMGRPIRLTPDGRFRVRMTFPDGTIEFPVEATAADGLETRSVMPVVNRKTY